MTLNIVKLNVHAYVNQCRSHFNFFLNVLENSRSYYYGHVHSCFGVKLLPTITTHLKYACGVEEGRGGGFELM